MQDQITVTVNNTCISYSWLLLHFINTPRDDRTGLFRVTTASYCYAKNIKKRRGKRSPLVQLDILYRLCRYNEKSLTVHCAQVGSTDKLRGCMNEIMDYFHHFIISPVDYCFS